jgi:hypothetical protein
VVFAPGRVKLSAAEYGGNDKSNKLIPRIAKQFAARILPLLDEF